MSNSYSNNETTHSSHRVSYVRDGLYFILVIALVFSVQFEISRGVSKFVSINSEDFVIFAIGLTFLADLAFHDQWQLRLRFPRLTGLLCIIGGWITVSTLVAFLQFDIAVTESLLWTVKWWEVVVFFVVVQHQLDRYRSLIVVKTLLMTGIALSLNTLYVGLFTPLSRNALAERVLWVNPNTLASFLALVVVLCLAYTVASDEDWWYRVTYLTGGVLASMAIVVTGSRAGLLGLLVSLVVLIPFLSPWLNLRQYEMLAVGSMLGLGAVSFLARDMVRRLYSWISFEGGRLQLADNAAAFSFTHRIELVGRALDLAAQRPLFGYGWFATSGQRLGFFEIHITTLLVDLGIVGLVMFGVFYLFLLKRWIRTRVNGSWVLAGVGTAWYLGLLAASIGNNNPRVPRIQFVLLLLLVTADAIVDS